MKVVVTIIEDLKDVRVRKCPPNYPTNGEGEFVVELEDYTEEDIKEYFTKEDLTAWKEEHHA